MLRARGEDVHVAQVWSLFARWEHAKGEEDGCRLVRVYLGQGLWREGAQQGEARAGGEEFGRRSHQLELRYRLPRLLRDGSNRLRARS